MSDIAEFLPKVSSPLRSKFNANGFRYRWQDGSANPGAWFLSRSDATTELEKYATTNPGVEKYAVLIRERKHDGEQCAANYGK